MERLKDGYYVRIPQLGKDIGKEFWVITGSEPFNYKTGDSTSAEFSAVADGSESGYKNISVLEPNDTPRRIYQVVMGVKDGCQYYVKIPSGANRFGVDVDKDVGYLDNNTSYYLAKNEMYLFWLAHNYYPSINAVNDTGISKTPQVFFEGYKYDIEPVSDAATLSRLQSNIQQSTMISIGGVKT